MSVGGTSNSIYRISDPEGAPNVTAYSNPGPTDGIAFAPDGTLYSNSDYEGGNASTPVDRIAGTNSATPGAVTQVAIVPGGPTAASAVATDPSNPTTAKYLFVNCNNGTLTKVTSRRTR